METNYNSIEALHQNTPFYCITDFINSFQSDITFKFVTQLLQSYYKALFYSSSIHIAAEQPNAYVPTITLCSRWCCTCESCILSTGILVVDGYIHLHNILQQAAGCCKSLKEAMLLLPASFFTFFLLMVLVTL
jgi:hypothetical protein